MLFCIKCNNFSDDDAKRCTTCGSKKLREAQDNDPVFLCTKKGAYADMLAQAIESNSIPFIKKERFGGMLKYAGFGLGINIGDFDFFVPLGAYKKAKSIVDELFLQRENKFVYRINDSLYINLTNECPCDCQFCIRQKGAIEGNNLWLDREPSCQEVIELIKQESDYKEIVFCGFGEPTYRIKNIQKIAAYAKEINKKTRLNTNGLGMLVGSYPSDITKYLTDIDIVSVSLNAPDKETYDKITRPIYKNAYQSMLSFAKKCIEKNIKVIMTVVDILDENQIEKCRQIAADLGADFKVRQLIE